MSRGRILPENYRYVTPCPQRCGPLHPDCLMNTSKLLFGIWLLGVVGLGALIVNSAAKNSLSIGVRTYHREEYLRRYEQWMSMPLVALFASVSGGLGTGLVLLGGLSSLWGVIVVVLTFIVVQNVGLWRGLIKQKETAPRWGAGSSLEAMHAEIIWQSARQSSLSKAEIVKMKRRLASEDSRIDAGDNLPQELDLGDIDWRTGPRWGFGPNDTSENVVTMVRWQQSARFLFCYARVQRAIVLACWACAVGWLVLQGVKVECLRMLSVVAMLVVPTGFAMVGARAELIYRNRSRAERRYLARDALTKLEAIERRRRMKQRRGTRGPDLRK